jgi:signal-transduction protein with cAMP-binding, CBS, and nucleotidyltransferase domain
MLKEIVSRNLVTAEPDAKISEVARLMADRGVGAVLILEDDDKPRGIITDRDIVLRCVADHLDVEDTTVENVLSESVHTVLDTDGLYDVIHKMREARVRRIAVVDKDGKAVGVISFGDIVSILAKELSELGDAATSPLREVADAVEAA